MRTFFDFEFIEAGAAFVMEPISVGMAREDGETYYAEFSGVQWGRANDFVLKNVRPHLRGPIKSKLTIAREIREFVGEKPEFWAYFADYDWVLLCQLYGAMVQLPEGWPYYCRDVKQLMDHLGVSKEQLDVENPQEHDALADAVWNLRAHDVLTRMANDLHNRRHPTALGPTCPTCHTGLWTRWDSENGAGMCANKHMAMMNHATGELYDPNGANV